MLLERKADKEEREKRELALSQDTARAEHNNTRIKQIILFPGSIEEYERFRGYGAEIVDTLRRDKGVYIGELKDFGVFPKTPGELWSDSRSLITEKRNFIEHLLASGVEALVNVCFETEGSSILGEGSTRS